MINTEFINVIEKTSGLLNTGMKMMFGASVVKGAGKETDSFNPKRLGARRLRRAGSYEFDNGKYNSVKL